MSDSAKQEQTTDPGRRRRGFWSGVWFLILLFIYLVSIAWAAGAIYFDGPGERNGVNVALAAGWVIVTLFFLFMIRAPKRRFAAWVVAMVVVIVPWLAKQPTDDRNWQPQWAKTGWSARFDEGFVIHNFRNFDYALDGTVTERWEKRTVHLSKLRGLDYFHHAFGGELLAHPVLSFDFGDEGHVAFSVETRREVGEKYEPVGGLYKLYGLIYIVGDERDFIRDRATIRDEPVRIHRAKFDAERIRDLFVKTIATMNDLHENPRFYNTLTDNCTTSFRAQTAAQKRSKFDIRMLANGKLESLLYERGAIETGGLELEQLLEQASINEAAKAAHDDPDFSAKIREGRVGYE